MAKFEEHCQDCERVEKVGYEPELLKEVLKTNDKICEIRKTRREQND